MKHWSNQEVFRLVGTHVSNITLLEGRIVRFTPRMLQTAWDVVVQHTITMLTHTALAQGYTRCLIKSI